MNSLMKTIALFALLISLPAVAGAADHTVTMKSLSFDPKSLAVKVGDTVTWINKSYTEHSATADTDPVAFDTGRIAPQKSSAKVKLSKAGTFSYHCSIHGKTMSAQLVVGP